MIAFINALISKMGAGLTALFAMLPPSPFEYTYTIDSNLVKTMNYLFPFSQAVAHLSAFISATAIYYMIRIALKWLKAAGN